jgi:PDZ domain-containing secreted protein
MKPRMICAVVIIGLFTGLALAHDGSKHVKGTVVEVGENSIIVETLEKQKHTIAVDEKTKFEKSGSAATMQELKVGDRVVVDVHESGETMHGSLVRFGKPKSGHQKPQSH